MKKKVFILIAGFLLIGTNIYAAGDLTVMGNASIGGENLEDPMKLVVRSSFGPTIALANNLAAVKIFEFQYNQNDHLSTMPGGAYDYYLFEGSAAGRNKELRVYGYPTGAGSRSYGSLQVTGTNTDFEIKTGSGSGNIILTPGAGVGIGTATPTEKLEVAGNVKAQGWITGDITFQKGGESLWRMFEDEDGLYLESVRTGKLYRFVLQEVEKK